MLIIHSRFFIVIAIIDFNVSNQIGGAKMTYRAKKIYLITRRWIRELILMIIGSAIMAFGTAFFLLPNHLSSGGFSGIATITYYLLAFPMGTTIIVLNLPLFAISLFKLGRRFFIKAIIGTGLLSLFLNIFDGVEALTTDRLLASIYGGILIGIGTAIILKANASTGGSDLLSNIITKFKPTAKTGNIIVMIDCIIVGLNVLFFREIEIALYSVIAIYLSGQMIDIIFEGTNFTKMIFIVSNKYEEIAKQIGIKIGRGSTGIYAQGMYNEKDRMMLWCVASRREVSRIKRIASRIDPNSFLVISNAREALGQGFKRIV